MTQRKIKPTSKEIDSINIHPKGTFYNTITSNKKKEELHE
jgi:hypothetical protein